MGLRDVVDGATPGPWNHSPGLQYPISAGDEPVVVEEGIDCVSDADGRFIATFDPVMVGALLDVCDAAQLWCGGEQRLLPRRVARALARVAELTEDGDEADGGPA